MVVEQNGTEAVMKIAPVTWEVFSLLVVKVSQIHVPSLADYLIMRGKVRWIQNFIF